MLIRREQNAERRSEGGCDFRRLYPWKERADTEWGSGWAQIAVGTRTTQHWHDEEETFIILSGNGRMRVNDEVEDVGKGDVIFIPRGSAHTLENVNDQLPLEMLCIWWGGDEHTVSHEVDLPA